MSVEETDDQALYTSQCSTDMSDVQGHGTIASETSWSAYGLQEQIDQKIAFLEEFFPPTCQFILVGHSIGAYIILKLFEHFGKKQNRVMKGILLFPTIERMAMSPKGRITTPVSNYLALPLVAVAWSLSWLPVVLKKCLINLWFCQRNVDDNCRDAALELVNAKVVRNMLAMAADEMEKVDQTPSQLISDHIDKLVFYYGVSDPWVPRNCYSDMVQRFPKARIYRCERNLRHAFVLESSQVMADIVAGWIDRHPS